MTAWTDDLITRIKHERTLGLSVSTIAKRHGLTKNQVMGKLWRMNGGSDGIVGKRTEPKSKPVRIVGNAWDQRVFEPYSEFKARKERERDAARS